LRCASDGAAVEILAAGVPETKAAVEILAESVPAAKEVAECRRNPAVAGGKIGMARRGSFRGFLGLGSGEAAVRVWRRGHMKVIRKWRK